MLISRSFKLLEVIFAASCLAVIQNACAQSLSAFGPAPPSKLLQQIRPVAQGEFSKIQTERICNKSIPLVGGGELLDADLAKLRESVAKYATWEKEYQKTIVTNSLLAQLAKDPGKQRYFYERSQGVSASTIDIFSRTFLLRNLYSAQNYDEASVEADKLIAQYSLKPISHQVDEAEKGTYLTKEALSTVQSD